MKVLRSHTTPQFEEDLLALSKKIQIKTGRKIKLFEDNCFHPSLNTHKLKGALRYFWSFSIDNDLPKISPRLLKLIILSLLLIFWWNLFISSSRALISPQVYFIDLSLSKNNFEPGELVQGSASLWNYEQFVVSDLVFHFQLLGKEVNGVPTELIDGQIAKEVFSLSASEKATKSFTYNLPANLPEGNFKLRIRLANTRGEEMGWMDKVISIGGEGKFLTLDNYWIVEDGQNLSPGGGVYYQPGEIPEIRFDIKNNSSFTISAFPKITTYKRNVGGEVLSQEQKESLILKPGEIKTQKAFLPLLTKPDSYLSEVRLYSNEDQKPISNSIYFRWIISGQDDAEILFVQPDKSSYQAGEEAKIKVQFTGPAHYEIEGGQGVLKVKLINEKGEVVGEGEKKIELKVGQEIINIPVREGVNNPKVATQIVKDEKILDQYEFQAKSLIEKKEEKREEPKKISFWQKNKKIISVLFLVIILIIAIIIYYLKIKKGKTFLSSLIFFLLFGLLFIAGSISAATEVADSPDPTTIIFNSPAPDQTYKPGDIINFSGGFRVTGCGNGLFFNKIEFFIAENKEIPIKNRNCCGDCCGGQSTTYTCSSMPYCDIVQILDTSQPNYKIRKLGTIYPADVAAGATPYWVEYNQSFTIPSDLGFWGPVRFYVQYSGTHWNSHWHWNITYQPGYLNNPPSASNLSVTQPDYCIITWPAAIFSWQFTDPDNDTQSAYQIQIDNNSNFSSPEVDTGKILSSSNSYVTLPGKLSWNTTYYWQLKVWDSKDLSSAWISGSSFATPLHACPTINFSWTPQSPATNENTQFTDQSFVYGGSTKSSWSWTFQDGNPASSAQQNPIVKFLSAGAKSVTLRVTDSDGFSCQAQKTINSQLPLPEWIEIPPF